MDDPFKHLVSKALDETATVNDMSDNSTVEPVSPTALGSNSTNTDRPSFKEVPTYKRLKWIFFKPEQVSRKKWLLINASILILLTGAVWGSFALFQHFSKTGPLSAQPKATPRPTLEPSKLTGILVDPKLNQRTVTGVMIENSPDARPQSGLLDAGVVVEAIAEGGITRFLALYQEAQPQYIGPVRSVRPYYLDFVLPFNASIAHVGGSPEALGQVKGLNVRDLDEFYNDSAYQRITTRYAPHNVYTSFKGLDALNRSKHYNSTNFTSWPRKKDQASTKPTASSISMNISGYYYNTHYDYSRKTNSYNRSEGGAKHTDFKTKKQLSPKVLIALVMNYSIESDGKHSQYDTIGKGTAFVFQDGIVTKAVWHKSSRSSQISFTDAKGNPVKLNAGQTWITLLGSAGNLTYK